MPFISTEWKFGSILKVFCLVSSESSNVNYVDGVSTIDSKSDYTDDDFVVSNNCTDFEGRSHKVILLFCNKIMRHEKAYKSFTSQMMEIDRQLIEQRNKIDQGIKEDAKKNGLLSAIIGTFDLYNHQKTR